MFQKYTASWDRKLLISASFVVLASRILVLKDSSMPSISWHCWRSARFETSMSLYISSSFNSTFIVDSVFSRMFRAPHFWGFLTSRNQKQMDTCTIGRFMLKQRKREPERERERENKKIRPLNKHISYLIFSEMVFLWWDLMRMLKICHFFFLFRFSGRHNT